MNKNLAQEAIEKFLSFPLGSSAELLLEFASLPRAISHLDGGKKNFVYVPGTRDDRVLLVAHADTVWDLLYTYSKSFTQEIVLKDGIYRGKHATCGIGADDRAGCAMLWLLRESGHSLLVVDGEEYGQIGSNHIRESYPDIFDELNKHSYMLQLDRRESNNYKVYRLPVSREFIEFIESTTGYSDAGKSARTDIVTLCRDVCGVNLSIGYRNEHSSFETLDFEEWFATLTLVEGFLAAKQKSYPLDNGI